MRTVWDQTDAAGSKAARTRAGVGGRLIVLLALLVASIVAGGVTTRAASAQEANDAPATAAFAPEETVAFLSVDLDFASEQWRQTDELLARAGFPNALADLQESMFADLEMDSPEVAAELDAILGGELGLVVTEQAIAKLMEQMAAAGASGMPAATPVGEADSIGVAAVLLPSDADAAWNVIEAEIERQAAERGVTVEEIDYDGVTIWSIPANEFSSSGTAIARQDEAILVAGFPADLEPIIDTGAGDAPSLADADWLTDVRGELTNEALLYGFFNGQSLVDAFGAEFLSGLQSLMPQGASMGSLAYPSGLALWADDPGLRLDVISVVPPGEDPPFAAENADLTVDERVPAETLVFVGGVLPEVPGLFNGVALTIAEAINGEFGQGTPVAMPTDFMTRFSPEYIEAQFAAAEAVLGFDLRADLFDQFQGEYVMAGSFAGLMAGAQGVSGVVATGVADPAVVADSVEQVVRLIETSPDAPAITTRQVEGDTVYVVQDPNATDFPVIELGVVGDELILGIGTGLDDYLNGPSSTLADDEQFQRVLATLPSEYNQLTYVDISQIVPLVMMAGAMGSDGDTIDADPACAEFSTQAAAQETYDADPFTHSNLDLDFDGEACEDFFAPATPEATPVTAGSYENIEAFAAVTFRNDEVIGQSAILYIAES